MRPRGLAGRVSLGRASLGGALPLALATVALTLGTARCAPSERTRPPEASTEAAERSREALGSLGYLARVDASDSLDKRGVTTVDPERSAEGSNLFSSLDSHRALLVDRDGTTLHQWSAEVGPADRWQHVEPLPGGSLLALVEESRLIALDRESRPLWTLEAPVHHDVAPLPSGDCYVLVHEPREVERGGETLPVLADSILRLDPAGRIVGRLELLPIFESHVSEEQWADLVDWLADFAEPMARLGPRIALKSGSPADLFHTNSVEVLPRDVPPIGTEGDLLISLRDIDTVAVVDFASGALRWSWGPGVIRRQHQPSLLDNDHLLMFDNRGGSGGRSRVIEVDPHSGEIVWSYQGDPPESFFSGLRGGAQRLANGNTLITESDRGRAFEVTPAGEIIWEFYNPLVDESDRTRPAIYRMARLTPAEIAWID